MKSLLPSIVILLWGAAAAPAAEPTLPVVPLWPAGAAANSGPEQVRLTDAGEHVVTNVHVPSLTIVLPDPARATGAGVVVCPGGGHSELWMDHEGYNVARWLADRGIAAFILKYRLARQPGSSYHVDVESLADAQRALRLVRYRAAEWRVDPDRIGIMGFSAGGGLAALAAARFDTDAIPGQDAIDRLSCRPAFQALIYPGAARAAQPPKNAPPAFLLCGNDDTLTPPEDLTDAFRRFKRAGIPAELHIYTGAGHGFGLRATNAGPVAAWLERLHEWLGERGLLHARP